MALQQLKHWQRWGSKANFQLQKCVISSKIFWHYTRKDPGDTFSNFISHWLFPAPIVQPIRHNGETIGEVRLTARDSSISHFIWFSLAVLTACILLASGIAITLTRHLHNGLVEALKNITDVVHDVRSNRNFSRRVSEERIAEFHRFALDFNSLLDEMEEWQLRLQAKNAQLLRTALHDPLTGLANRAAFRSGINTLMNTMPEKRRRYYFLMAIISNISMIPGVMRRAIVS